MSMEASTSSPETRRAVAVLNAGSSSIKFALYEAGASEALLYRGQIESIGVAPRLKLKDAAGELVDEQSWPAAGFDHAKATQVLLERLVALLQGTPVAGVGHRVVHGGAHYDAPVRVDTQIIDALARLAPLAPLHQPHNLAPIRAIAKARPDLPQVACFDTAFHRRQPNLAQLFGLPRELTDAGVRRY